MLRIGFIIIHIKPVVNISFITLSMKCKKSGGGGVKSDETLDVNESVYHTEVEVSKGRRDKDVSVGTRGE